MNFSFNDLTYVYSPTDIHNKKGILGICLKYSLL